MNFHKTIGFLATLLLVLGFGVPDSFAQANTINVSLSRDNYVREGSSVVVTVTVDPEVAANTTVTANINVVTTTGFTVTLDPTTAPPVAATSATVDIPAGDDTGTITLHIVDDDTYIHTGTLTVYVNPDDAVMLPIRDNDDATGDLTLTVTPPSVTAGADGPQDVTLKVALAEAPGVEDGVTVTVAVTAVAVVDDDPANNITVSIEIEGTAKDNTGTLFIPPTAVENPGAVEVTASADNYRSDMISIPIISRTADDVEGFRVVITAPGDGAWVGFGAKKVKVDVIRLDKTQSYPWTAFQSLAVSLRDTTNASQDFITVTAGSFADEDGNIIFTKAVSGATGGSGTAPVAKNSVIAYDEPSDKLTFQIELVKTDNVDTSAPTAPATVLGTLTGEDATTGEVTDPAANTNHPQAGLTAKGQRMGVYASAVFTVGTNTYRLNSNDDKKKVFSNPATPGADQSVGDGDHIKIDLLAPDNEASAINITLNNSDDSAEGTEAKIGDELKVEVPIGAQQRFIRDGGMQIQIMTIANDDASGNAKAATLKTANFTQAQISAAAGDVLRTSLKLNAGTIKNRATADGHTRDGVKIKKNSTEFEPDYIGLRARVRTKDQAGNFSGAVQKDLTADTRAPVIHVLHPADGGRFTGDHADTNWDEFLNPLRIRLDEDVDSLYVYADGVLDANNVTADNFFEEDSDGNGGAAIVLWSPDDDRDLDRSEIAARHGATSVGDTIVYNTVGLKWKKGNNNLDATGQGGTKVNLKIVALDLVGNRTVVTLTDVVHDQKPPTISDWFPRNDLLEDDNNQINDATRHPVVTLKEAVDSLSVTYDPSSGDDIVEEMGALAKGEHQVLITESFDVNKTYTLTIFARDLAGNSFETPSQVSADFEFNDQFVNAKANMFVVENITPADSDSVVAGQAFYLRLKARDDNGTPDNDDDDRAALTYKNGQVEDNMMAEEVRISAWAGGGAAESVRFHGGGVTDNGDGTASLNAGAWKLGERTVYAKSNMAVDDLKILVEHRDAGMGGTSVVSFDGAIEDLTVDAADFASFEITAWEDGVDGAASEVWGDFNLRVVPVDKFGNPSVKAYKTTPSKGNNSANAASVTASTDSLGVLDTRLTQTAHNYKNGIDANLRSLPDIGLPPFEWTIELAGETFPVTAPANAKQVAIQVRIDNTSLKDADTRSQDIKATASFVVRAPLELSITLWVPGQDGDQAGNTVNIPAGGSVDVTARAEGLNEGDTVTFSALGVSADVTADANGYASLPITLPGGSGTVTVTASSGQYSASLDVVFEELAGRVSYVDSNGDPVYLISNEDMTANTGDYLALLAAWGSSEGDADYNVQADVNDDGMVNIDDYLIFIASWGRTATGPASKPLVLIPGVNENAEFSLSLGSERVVAGELMAVDVSLANVAALMGYGFTLNYETDKFEFVSVAPADEDLLTSTGGESKLFHHMVADGQVEVVNGVIQGTAISGGGDIVRFVFRVLREFEDNARFEIANGLVFDPSQLQNPAVVAGVLELQSTPREFALHQNFPNPFNPDTTIKYDLAESADVTLQIYNVLGQVVRTLVASEAQSAGRYQIRWNGMDERGVPVSSGIYFYQIAADGKFSDVRKLMLLK
jgi:hypothetical protein